MQLIKLLFYILPSILVTNIFANTIEKNTVLICYGKLNPQNIKGYTYVILESKYYLPSDIRVIKAQNDKVFAYISLGEVNVNANYYSSLKNNTLGKNEVWNSYYLDLKWDKTLEIVLKVIDDIFKKGYDGLFLDNLDNFTFYGPQKDQKSELIALLKSIKEKYPDKKFIQNAGLELVKETATLIDFIAIESVATDYSFYPKKYKLRDTNEFKTYLNQIKLINNTYEIPIILIEYADSKQLYNQIIERIKPSQFDYFIGKIDLQTVPIFKNELP